MRDDFGGCDVSEGLSSGHFRDGVGLIVDDIILWLFMSLLYVRGMKKGVWLWLKLSEC